MFYYFVVYSLFCFLNVYIYLFIISPFIILQPYRKGKSHYLKKNLPTSPADLGYDFDEINFQNDENLKISAWLIKAKDPIGTIIYSHGIGETKMSGLFLLQQFIPRNYNILLYDLRAHGESQGQYCTFGYYEKYDLQNIIKKLRKNSDYKIGKIGLYGTSLGAAVSIQTVAVEQDVQFCISEASFSELRLILKDYQDRGMFKLISPITASVFRRTQYLASFNINEVSPLKSISSIRTPILFIHGSDDSRVNIDYCTRMFDNSNPHCEQYIVQNADHNNLHETGDKSYFPQILKFIEKNI